MELLEHALSVAVGAVVLGLVGIVSIVPLMIIHHFPTMVFTVVMVSTTVMVCWLIGDQVRVSMENRRT